MKTKQAEQKGTYLRAFQAAFPYTVPVLTGYLFIGMAFGVMIQEKGYNFLWAMLMSLVIYAGSGQYLAELTEEWERYRTVVDDIVKGGNLS